MDPDRLTAIPIFSELSPEEARRLATFATETSAAEGQILLKEGDYSVELIAIEEGTAEVLQGGRTIASLHAGDLIGEMGLLRAPAAQRRRDRLLADASAAAHALGDPADVRRDRQPDQGDHRAAAPVGRRRPVRRARLTRRMGARAQPR